MITNLAQIKRVGHIPTSTTDFDDALTSDYGPMAAARLTKLVSAAKYALATATLKIAEAMLVMYYALPAINDKINADGGLTASGIVGDGSFRYRAPQELEQHRAQILADVERLLLDVDAISDETPIVSLVEADFDDEADWYSSDFWEGD